MSVAAKEADIVVMAAAPADYTPAATSRTKIKKSGGAGLELELIQTTDVLARLVADRTDDAQVLIGFGAETPDAEHSLLDLGRAKLVRGLRPVVLNRWAGRVFGADGEITLVTATTSSARSRRDTLSSHLGCALTCDQEVDSPGHPQQRRDQQHGTEITSESVTGGH
jgi:phosphopantothenoylcysteine decarboxylase/phosphopantothenate--cysteine ligase